MVLIYQIGLLVPYSDAHYILGSHTDQKVSVGLDIECDEVVLVGGLVEGCIDIATVVEQVFHQELSALMRIFK